MSKIITCLFLISVLASCGSNNTQTEIIQDKSKSNFDNQQAIKLSEKLHGLWISDSYLENIKANKSIYLSRNYKTKILGFQLDKKNLLTDSAFLEGFTDHEGGYDSPIKYDNIKDQFIADTSRLSGFPGFSSFELSYGGHMSLEMYFQKTKSVDKYRKLNSDLQTELRKLLIAGKYKMTNNNSEVKFDNDGTVQNFQGFKYYELVANFGLAIEYDAIVFFNSLEGGNWSDGEIFKFEIVSGELHLQHVQTNWDTMEHTISEEILILEWELQSLTPGGSKMY